MAHELVMSYGAPDQKIEIAENGSTVYSYKYESPQDELRCVANFRVNPEGNIIETNATGNRGACWNLVK